MRTIILHYHLFKNAGSSIDAILKKSFEDRWVTREFNEKNNTDQLAEWILSNPDAIAFSSHTMNGPIPQIDGVKIISIAMLRDPIQRIISAYKFERNQNADTWGAQLAKQSTFEEYVVARLQKRGDTQCRNFQVERLATLRPGKKPSLERAITTLDDLSVFGIVEDFNKSLALIAEHIRKDFPDYENNTVHDNKSKTIDINMSTTLKQLLEECNKEDHALWSYAYNVHKRSMTLN